MGGDDEFSICCEEFEIVLRHPNEDIEQALGQ